MNLRKRILIVLLIFCALCVGGWIAMQLFMRHLTAVATSDTEKRQKLFTDMAASDIEHYFYDIQKRLETIALIPNVRDGERSESCNQNLQDLLQANSNEFSNLARVSKDGTFMCAVNRTIVGEPVSKYGTYFDKILKDPQHKPVMSRLIRPSGTASPVIGVHVAVYDSKGQFNGTVGGAIYFDELQNRLLLKSQSNKDAIMAIYDDNLDILYHPDPLIRSNNLVSDEILKLYSPRKVITDFAQKIKTPPTEGVIDYSLRGDPRHTVYKSVAVIGRYWTIGVAMPQKFIQQAAKDTSTYEWFIAAVGLCILAITTSVFVLLRPAATPSKGHK